VRVLLDVSAVPARPVGAGVYTLELARALGRRDDVELVLLARRDDGARWAAVAPGAEVHPLVPAPRPARLAWEQAAGPRVGIRLRADLWHGPHYTVPLRLAVPAVVTLHDPTFFDHPEWHERAKVRFFRWMVPRSVRQAAVCVSVSRYTATRMAQRFPHDAPDVVIPHGVDHARFRVDDSATPTDLAALGARGIVPPYVAFTGTLEPRKDLPTLVAAFAAVAGARPDLRLVLAGGDGWGADAVRDAIAASGAATRILRTGYLPAELLPPLLRRAAAVAYPSHEEGFGLPALEALACGAPLVTTTGSAVEELVGDAALLVPPHDPDRLARALVEALDDEAVAARLRAAGPARAAGLTWEACAAAHVEAYRRAIGT
jgi:glycosyltransferase involved in cell wall biosynthesis